jgi:hypothetical protein
VNTSARLVNERAWLVDSRNPALHHCVLAPAPRKPLLLEQMGSPNSCPTVLRSRSGLLDGRM